MTMGIKALISDAVHYWEIEGREQDWWTQLSKNLDLNLWQEGPGKVHAVLYGLLDKGSYISTDPDRWVDVSRWLGHQVCGKKGIRV